MPLALFALLVMLAGVSAGLVGSLTGLGGGLVLTPVLTLAFGVDFRYAAGASLICAIATSSGAGSAYIKEGLANFRIGLFLLIATCGGALVGASLSGRVSHGVLQTIFGVVLAGSALLSARKRRPHPAGATSDALATRLRLAGVEPCPEGPKPYPVQNTALGFGIMGVAGVLSGLLGIGSGALKVLAMDEALRLPFKVSTTTSNFMIGITATVSVGVYLGRGQIDPLLVAPVVVGVLIGSRLGAKLLERVSVITLRRIFMVVMFVLAAQMIWKGLA